MKQQATNSRRLRTTMTEQVTVIVAVITVARPQSQIHGIHSSREFWILQ